ncbi:hypothetical protein OEA41_005108 [Lepraria neglecta]|uniref:Natural resistance-associated macrophage protein n=1 Tax=Lepraria neglecta TaxID=209136 RepID=A0AAD9YZX4_9LECA|nr:hypothetical protein OEA41_005108 [Lepraria neglecta]
MNCPSRTDEPPEHDGYNQNPPSLAADLTTRQDLNGIVNLRTDQDFGKEAEDARTEATEAQTEGSSEFRRLPDSAEMPDADDQSGNGHGRARNPMNTSPPPYSSSRSRVGRSHQSSSESDSNDARAIAPSEDDSFDRRSGNFQKRIPRPIWTIGRILNKFLKFVGPGFLVAVAYIDPGNYSTDVSAGAATQFKLLFIVLMSNFFAIILQSLAIRLGTVTGLNLAQHCRAHLPRWMNIVLYLLGEAAIIATDIAEVLKGYIPSSTVVDGQGLYLSCGILGATVMPHSLYLGSGMVQPRLRDFDTKAGNTVPDITDNSDKVTYRPSLAAIRSCMSYSITEVGLSLSVFALFVNSAILIVAGASLTSSSAAETGGLFGIHDLLSKTLAPAAGTIFALALLLSGTSAGIVCTIAGQILSEGALNWKIAPWLRRFATRTISIIPSIIIAGAVGKEGLSAALNATQVALSIALPFISAPLIYFTCRNKYMVVGGVDRVAREDVDGELELDEETEPIKMRNAWALSVLAVLIWLVIAIMNVALLVLLGLGKA